MKLLVDQGDVLKFTGLGFVIGGKKNTPVSWPNASVSTEWICNQILNNPKD